MKTLKKIKKFPIENTSHLCYKYLRINNEGPSEIIGSLCKNLWTGIVQSV
jgi:hypothetical protein